MKKKRIVSLMSIAAFTGVIALSTVSCKSSDDAVEEQASSVVTIDAGLLANGITIDANTREAEISVTSNGEWSAVLPDGYDGPRWLEIKDDQVIYNGNKTLKLLFDVNPNSTDRSTTLSLYNNQFECTKVTIRQRGGDLNAAGSGSAFQDKGLGHGVDYNYAMNMQSNRSSSMESLHEAVKGKFSPTKVMKPDNVYDTRAIQELQALTDPTLLLKNGYVESAIQQSDLQALMFDSCLVQSKKLSVELKMGIELSVISFEAAGKFNSKVQDSKARIDYAFVRNAPMYNAYYEPGNLRAYASGHNNMDEISFANKLKFIENRKAFFKKMNELKKEKNVDADGLTAKQAAEINKLLEDLENNIVWDFGGIYSINMKTLYSNLYNCFYDSQKQPKKVPNKERALLIVKQIDNDYGPFLISGAEFGGQMDVHLVADTLNTEGRMKIEGELSGSAQGIFSVSGKFNYKSEGFSLMHKYKTNIHIFGGNANSTADKMLAMITSDKPDDRKGWRDCLTGWVKSMVSDNGQGLVSQAMPISFTMTPIWNIFAESDIQEFVKQWFLQAYNDRKPNLNYYYGVATGEIDPTKNIDDVVNGADSTKK